MRIFPLIFAVLTLPVFADDESTFASPPPVAWQRYDPRSLAGLSPALFDFSAGQCRLACAPPATTPEYYAFGLARAGLFATEIFTDACASVDITAWNATTNRSADGTFIGVFTRVQSPVTLGNLNGYSASILDMGPNSGPGGVGRNGRLQLMRVTAESNFLPLTGYMDFPLDSSHDYRLVLVSSGNLHTTRIFDLSDPTVPVAQISGSDSTFATGRTGIMILTDRVAPVDATFDNFLAWDGSAPPLAIQNGAESGTIELSCDFRRAMATDLQSSIDLGSYENPWQPAFPQSTSQSGDQLVSIFPIDGPTRFFRRKSL